MVWEITALVGGGVSMAVAAYLYSWVMAQTCESDAMNEFSQAIQAGAAAYLKRLFQALALLAVAITVVISVAIGWQSAIAYLVGATCSGAAAYTGMYVATRANAKVAWAARSGIQKSFPVGFYAGGVMGLSVVGLALIGMTALYMIFQDTEVILGFSFGASSLALLAKAGGGIFTKTADIGADLVGKVEFDLDEDDPRNPAVIADNVGDNVGDVAGVGADIFDSYVASVVAVMVLGSVLYTKEFVIYPLLLGAGGIWPRCRLMSSAQARWRSGRLLKQATWPLTLLRGNLSRGQQLIGVPTVGSFLPTVPAWSRIFWVHIDLLYDIKTKPSKHG